MENLQRRGIGENDICPCCGSDTETCFHAIISCEVARRVWDNWGAHVAADWQGLYDISDVAVKVLEKGTSQDLEKFFGVAWSIRYNRNLVVFESTCQLPRQIWNFAIRYLHDYSGASLALNSNFAAKNDRWTPPPPGVAKINVDGATSMDGKNLSVGAIIRDSCGAVIAACCKYLQDQYSVMEVEAIAIETGFLLARDMRIPQIVVELDAVTAVNSINENLTNGSLGHLYQGILSLLKFFSSWKIDHVKRDYNRATHMLAHLARNVETSQVWVGVSPPFVQEVVYVDCRS